MEAGVDVLQVQGGNHLVQGETVRGRGGGCMTGRANLGGVFCSRDVFCLSGCCFCVRGEDFTLWVETVRTESCPVRTAATLLIGIVY